MICNAGRPKDRKLRCLIFDFDGTIVDSGPIFLDCINELSGEYGYEKITPGPGVREIGIHEFIGHLGLSPERLGEWTRKLNTLLKSAMRSAAPFAGMKEVFNRLCMHYRTGILTSNSEEAVRHILESSGFGTAAFIYPEVPILAKDKGLQDLLQRQGLDPRDAIYIGDDVRDIEACRKAGVKIVSVCWGFNTKDLLEKETPDYLVDSPEELSQLLLG